jgi:hypothetical protein
MAVCAAISAHETKANHGVLPQANTAGTGVGGADAGVGGGDGGMLGAHSDAKFLEIAGVQNVRLRQCAANSQRKYGGDKFSFYSHDQKNMG